MGGGASKPSTAPKGGQEAHQAEAAENGKKEDETGNSEQACLAPPVTVEAPAEVVEETEATGQVKRKQSYVPQTDLEKKVVQRLQSLHREKRGNGSSSQAVMNRVLLNFPKMQTTFSDLHRLYHETDTDGSGSLEIDEICVLMQKLNPGMSKDTVEQIFMQSDVATDGQINFKEFLTCLALGYLLNLIPDLNDTATEDEIQHVFKDSKAVKKVFELATELYLAFDDDCRGTITFDEMSAVINGDSGDNEMTKGTKRRKQPKETSSKGGVMVSFLSTERWKELDCDSDGYITYQEFMFTYVKWVASLSTEAGMDSEEEEEEDA